MGWPRSDARTGHRWSDLEGGGHAIARGEGMPIKMGVNGRMVGKGGREADGVPMGGRGGADEASPRGCGGPVLRGPIDLLKR